MSLQADEQIAYNKKRGEFDAEHLAASQTHQKTVCDTEKPTNVPKTALDAATVETAAT